MEEEHREERRISIEAFNKLADDVLEIKTALLGDLKTTGWLSRIRAVERSIAFGRWVMSVMGGIIIAIGINIVSSFFTK